MKGRARRRASTILLGAAAAGILASATAPFFAVPLLAAVRGHEIQAPAAIAVLSRLRTLAVVLGMSLSALIGSGGMLLRIADGDGEAPVPPGSRSPKSDLPPRRAVLLSLAVVASFLGLSLWAAGRSFSYDEILEMRRDWSTSGFPLPARGMANHYLATVLAHASSFAFGGGERPARIASVAAAAAGVVAVVCAGWRWTGLSMGMVLPAGFLAAHGFALEYAARVRGYSLMMWSALGLCLLVAARLDARARTAAGPAAIASAFVLGLVLGTSHFFGFLYLGFITLSFHLYCWTGWRALGPDPGRIRTTALSGIAAVLSVAVAIAAFVWVRDLPWLFYYSGAGPAAAAAGKLRSDLSLLAVGTRAGAIGAAAALALAAAVATVWRRVPALRLAAAAGVVPVVGAAMAAAAVSPRFFELRFFAPTVPIAAMCAAAVVVRGKGRWRIAMAAALLASAVPGFLVFLRDARGYREQAGDLAADLRTFGDARSRFILVGDASAREVLSYYLPPERILGSIDRDEWEARRRSGAVDWIVSFVDPADTGTGNAFGARDGRVAVFLDPPTNGDSPMRAWRTVARPGGTSGFVRSSLDR